MLFEVADPSRDAISALQTADKPPVRDRADDVEEEPALGHIVFGNQTGAGDHHGLIQRAVSGSGILQCSRKA